MDTVGAFAIAGNLGGIPIEFGASSLAGIEAKQGSLFDDRAIFQVIRRRSHRRGGFWLMQFQNGSL